VLALQEIVRIGSLAGHGLLSPLVDRFSDDLGAAGAPRRDREPVPGVLAAAE